MSKRKPIGASFFLLRPEGVSEEEIIAKQTPAGAWTARQLAEWGVPWPPPHGWRAELVKRWRYTQSNEKAN